MKEAQLHSQTCLKTTEFRLSVEQDCDALWSVRVARRPEKRGLKPELGRCDGQNWAWPTGGKLRLQGRHEVLHGGVDPICSKLNGSVVERRLCAP